MIKRLGQGLFDFPIHAHMIRHACGYYLANRGTDTRTIQDYLGHRNIQNTERYTQLAPGKFKGLWS
jgi:type 1 fimbriae regulatory protein FimB/type 1 fimbriae regulatory protein FimE